MLCRGTSTRDMGAASCRTCTFAPCIASPSSSPVLGKRCTSHEIILRTTFSSGYRNCWKPSSPSQPAAAIASASLVAAVNFPDISSGSEVGSVSSPLISLMHTPYACTIGAQLEPQNRRNSTSTAQHGVVAGEEVGE
jgi:hypothetical protein